MVRDSHFCCFVRELAFTIEQGTESGVRIEPGSSAGCSERR